MVAAGGFGVPTMFFPDGQSLFGPGLVTQPTGERATALWEAFTAVLEFPEVYEIHRRPRPGLSPMNDTGASPIAQTPLPWPPTVRWT